MVEVLGAKTKQFGASAIDALNDTNVQTSLLGGAATAAATFMLSGAVTKDEIKKVFDDIVDMSMFTPLTAAINSLLPHAAIQGAAVVTTMLSSLQIGEKITDMLVGDDCFTSDGKLKDECKLRIAAFAGLIGAGCIYVTPYIQDAISGKLNINAGGLIGKIDDADKFTSILIKLAAIYIGGGLIYAAYGRFKVADTNKDDKCTEAEYEAWLNDQTGIGKLFAPVCTFVKPFLAVLPGFDKEVSA